MPDDATLMSFRPDACAGTGPDRAARPATLVVAVVLGVSGCASIPALDRALRGPGSDAAAPRDDADADGVADARDACLGTAASTSVDTRGCGLFDAVLGDVTFRSGSWWLSPRARGALDDVAERLVAFPEVRVRVIAHTDSQGPGDLNLALSARRAEAVVDYLRGRGVSGLQLESDGVGETRPLADDAGEAGRRRNRRVELMTLPDLSFDALAGGAIGADVWHHPPSAYARRAIEALETLGPTRSVEPALGAARASGTAGPTADPGPARARPATLPAPGFLPGSSLAGIVDGLDFESGSVRLGPATGAALERVRDELRRYPAARIAIMAHTDGVGDPEASRALSRERAEAVVERLVSLGVDPERLEAEGYGDSLPRAQGITEADRARNRRVEIRVLR